MTKSEFMNILEGLLNSIPYEDKKDIMYDYEEHFRIGLQNGKTEDEICNSLGEPKALAKLYRANYTLEVAQDRPSSANAIRAVFAAISLGFLNLVFVFGPFIAICAVVISLFVSALAVIISGIATIASPFIPILNTHVHILGSLDIASIPPIAPILIGIGTTSLGLLFIIGDLYIAKYFYKVTMKYLKWNISIITDKKEEC